MKFRQDGSYMADLLINKKYEVHGLLRKSATGNTKNITHLINNKKIFNKKFFLHKGDILDRIIECSNYNCDFDINKEIAYCKTVSYCYSHNLL